MGQDGVEGSLGVHEEGAVPVGDVFHGGPVAVHLGAHGVGLVRLDVEGRHQDQPADRRESPGDEVVQGARVLVEGDMLSGRCG